MSPTNPDQSQYARINASAYGVHHVQPAAMPPETPRAPLVDREPALVAGGAASASVGVLISAFIGMLIAFDLVDPKQASALEAFLVVFATTAAMVTPWVAAKWTRSRVFAPATLEKAGLDPEHVEEVAKDPARSFVEASG